MLTYNKFLFFENILFTYGHLNVLLSDFQRGESYILDRNTINFLKIKSSSRGRYFKIKTPIPTILKPVIDFLIDNELIFYDIKKINFKKLSYAWDFPSKITNGIIEVISIDFVLLARLLNELSELNCYFIEIRLSQAIDKESLFGLIKFLNNFELISIEISINYFLGDETEFSSEIYSISSKISRITIYNSLRKVTIPPVKGMFGINFIIGSFFHMKHCGLVLKEIKNLTIEHFTESQHYNTCLNRKIAIDAEGNIKNCPSMAKSYGNIKDTSLIDVANSPEFQEVWHIKKDMIHVCKVCEFRHVCTDCRAYVEDPDDILSKPLKCGYNPYTGEWSEWSTNPLKQKAITFFGMQDLIKAKEPNA
jgi:SPASM domain peptide maturase of grasp-with-spasm system